MTTGPGGRSIGSVVGLLREEFPDVTVSKVRFLEAEGLVRPERLPSGLRRFSDADLERLRFVLRAQRDRFWPLRVIRQALDRMDQGLPPEPEHTASTPVRPRGQGAGSTAGGADQRDEDGGDADQGGVPPDGPPGAGGSLPTAEQLRRRRSVRLSAAELRDRAGLDQAGYAALKAYGLVRADASGRHGADDLDVARLCRRLAGYGLEPRHLRLFRVAADRQVGLADQILEPVRRRRARGDAAADPDAVQAELLAATLALQAALVRAGLEAGR